MTAPRQVLIGALALGSFLATVSAIAQSADPPPRRAECARYSTGVWSCTFTTSGRTARVMVRPFEDGSARVVALDPDDGRTNR